MIARETLCPGTRTGNPGGYGTTKVVETSRRPLSSSSTAWARRTYSLSSSA
jgi:hypothetical protein